jgi:hypothetical protein
MCYSFSGVFLPDANIISAAYNILLYHESMIRNAYVYVGISNHLTFGRLGGKAIRMKF